MMGAGLKTLSINIDYSEPTGAENREPIWVFNLNRELSGDVILDSDWLTTRVT